MTTDEYLKIIHDNLPKIQQDFGVTGLRVFGSVARGDNTAGSDLDILVDMPPKIFLMSALKDYLEQLLHTTVDLIRHHSHLSSRFITQISRDAITIL